MKNVLSGTQSQRFCAVVLAVVIGFSFAACGGVGPLDGTWVGTGTDEDDYALKIVASKGSWTMSIIGGIGELEVSSGTYTVSGKTVTLTYTHIIDWLDNELRPVTAEDIAEMGSASIQGTISGKQLTLDEIFDGITLTKQ